MAETDPSAEQLRALGKVAYNGGRLESLLAAFVWALIGDARLAQLITGRWSFDQLLQLAKRLLPDRKPELVKEFEVWETQAREAWNSRSELIHSWWAFDPQKEKVVRMRQKRGVGAVEMTVLRDEDLYTAAKKLTDATQVLAQQLLSQFGPKEIQSSEEPG